MEVDQYMTELIELDSPVRKLMYSQLAGPGKDGFSTLAKEYGVVYVTSITRDGCSGCEEQEPLYEQLARKVSSDSPGKTVFNNIHVQYTTGNARESEQAKSSLRHVAYPTYTVHVKSRHGVLEAYRAVYPKMDELELQIKETYDLADHYKKENEKLRTA